MANPARRVANPVEPIKPHTNSEWGARFRPIKAA